MAAGPSGTSNSICVASIDSPHAAQIEFEVPLGPTAVLRLHRACYQIWQEECEALPSG